MKILDKYLLKNLTKSSLLVLSSLVLVFCFFKFLEELTDIGQANYNILKAINYVLFLSPEIFNSLIILGVMIGSVLALGELNSNKELHIMQVSSISLKEIISKVITFALIISILLITIAELFFPLSSKFAESYRNQALNKNFTNTNSTLWIKQDDKYIFFDRDRQSQKFKEFLVFNTMGNRLKAISRSEEIDMNEENIIVKNFNQLKFLGDKTFSKFEKKELDTDILKFDFNNDHIRALKTTQESMSIVDLIRVIVFSYENQLNSTKFVVNLLERLVRPFTLIGMILIALPFVLDFSRTSSIGKRVFVAICVGILAHLLTKMSSIISSSIEGAAIIGPLIPTMVLLLVGLVLFRLKIR